MPRARWSSWGTFSPTGDIAGTCLQVPSSRSSLRLASTAAIFRSASRTKWPAWAESFQLDAVPGALLVRRRRYGRKEGDLTARPVSLVRIAGRWATFVSLNPETGGPPLGTDGLAGGHLHDGAEQVSRTREPVRATVSSSSTWTASATATAVGPMRCDSAGIG